MSCETKRVSGRTVTVKAKYADFRQITPSRTLNTAVRAAADVDDLALTLLGPLFPAERGVRLLGVRLSSLELSSEAGTAKGQLTLWQTGMLG